MKSARDPDQFSPERNWTRDYWRSVVVHEVAKQLGHTSGSLEGHVIALKESLGAAMRLLLDDLNLQEQETGRPLSMHTTCKRRAEEIASTFRHVATKHAPILLTSPHHEVFP